MNSPLFSVWFSDRFQTFEELCNQLFCPYFSPWHTFSISGRYRQENLRRGYVIPVLPTYFNTPGKGYLTNFGGYRRLRWAAEDLKWWPCVGQKILNRKTTSTEHTAELVRVLCFSAARGVLLRTLGRGVPSGSPNPDRFSDRDVYTFF